MQTELLDPAVKGTINVLDSCAKFRSVKRVVLTSSMAAIVCNNKPITPEVVADESWVFDPENCRKEKVAICENGSTETIHFFDLL